MKLLDYVTSEIKMVEDFNQYWLRENKKNPEQFPMDMEQGDWWDQYTAWSEIYND